jgi:hypothetical protein
MHFGSLTVDWPHKNHSRAVIPPKGELMQAFADSAGLCMQVVACMIVQRLTFITISANYRLHVPLEGFVGDLAPFLLIQIPEHGCLA